MKIQVKLFAAAKQVAGSENLQIDLARGGKIADLRAALVRQVPPLAKIVQHAVFAVNEQYADDDTDLSSDAEVALIPPVSGG